MILISSAGNALAARKITTVKGVLTLSAQGTAMLKTGAGDNGYFFNPDSEAGKKIMSTCQTGKMCAVRGVIRDKQILNAYYVNVVQ
jgi:hypothetical protein